MEQSRWIRIGTAILVAAWLGIGGAPTERPRLKPHPNIVLILTDDLDETLHSTDVMPHLKSEIADRGVTFDNFFVSLSLCCPSRASILRGQYAHNTRVFTNNPPNGGFETTRSLGLENSTMATWLHDAGYRTALLGKYLNGYPNGVAPTYVPPGWDEWDSPSGGNAYSEYNYKMNENGKVVPYGNAPEDYMVDVLSKKLTGFIQRSVLEKKPFFAYVATYAPHGPATPAPRYEGALPDAKAPRPPSFNEEDVSDKPAWLKARPPLGPVALEQMDALYRRRQQSLLGVDDLIAQLIQTLKQTGQLENTYIFFTSDNGFHMGEHRLPSGKNTAFEEDLRVPLVARGPGVPAGRHVEEFGANIDLAPTFADLAGAEIPAFVDGRSLAPLLAGRAPAEWRQALLLEHAGPMDSALDTQIKSRGLSPAAQKELAGMLEPPDAPEYFAQLGRLLRRRSGAGPPVFQGIRTKDYVYIEYVTGEKEMYDLKADPHELKNIAATADPALWARLSSWLAVLSKCSGAGCRSAESTPPAGPSAMP